MVLMPCTAVPVIVCHRTLLLRYRNTSQLHNCVFLCQFGCICPGICPGSCSVFFFLVSRFWSPWSFLSGHRTNSSETECGTYVSLVSFVSGSSSFSVSVNLLSVCPGLIFFVLSFFMSYLVCYWKVWLIALYCPKMSYPTPDIDGVMAL